MRNDQNNKPLYEDAPEAQVKRKLFVDTRSKNIKTESQTHVSSAEYLPDSATKKDVSTGKK